MRRSLPYLNKVNDFIEKNVAYLTPDEARFLVMRGDYSDADIIHASVGQMVIDAEGAEDLASSARY